jgi:predicted enzyme related to lactoylglutathione lyase
MNYSTFKARDGVASGFNSVTDQNPAGTVTVYIQTDNLTKSLREVERGGAKMLVPETEIPNTGIYGLFLDPQGKMVGLYRANPVM